MSYQDLRKLYYHGEEEWMRVYKERFDSPQTVHLNFYIGENQAFFVENAEVYALAYSIARMDKEVLRISHQLPGVALGQYSRKCLIDEIVVTNNIEGVHSSRKEIGEALAVLDEQAKAKKRHPRFEGLVNKYLKLLPGESIPLEDCADIRKLYDELFLEEVVAEDPNNRPDGKFFRKSSTSVYNAAQKVIHQGLFPETKIISAMDQALAFLNNEQIEKIFRICVFHFLFEYIHPFYDGNGRLGRFILSYCISDTLEPLIAFRISEIIKENIRQYWKAFEVCDDPKNLGDLTPFLIMQLKMIDLAIQELKESLMKRLFQWKKYEKLIPSLPNVGNKEMYSLYHVLIQAALFSESGISVKELTGPLRTSEATVRRLLKQVPSEWLEVKNKGRTKFYQVPLSELDALIKDSEQSAKA